MKVTCNSCSKELDTIFAESNEIPNEEPVDFKTWEECHLCCSRCKKHLYKTIYKHLGDIIIYVEPCKEC